MNFFQHHQMEPKLDHHLFAPDFAQSKQEEMHHQVPNHQKPEPAFLHETVAPDPNSDGNHFEEDQIHVSCIRKDKLLTKSKSPNVTSIYISERSFFSPVCYP